MVTLEAWAMGIPVLVNGACDVLRGQVIRGNAGLYYANPEEFVEALHVFASSPALRRRLGESGRQYFRRHYAWSVIERKYLEMLEQLRREDESGQGRPEVEPLPGWFLRRRRTTPAAADVVDGLPFWPSAVAVRGERASVRPASIVTTSTHDMRRPGIHQVMATLGYGDAIGNEALGIRQVLRDQGYDSRIYVQTSDPKVEDETEDYRDLIDDSHPDNILLHHFSLGSRASRLAFALPGRMILVYHNITPPEYFIGVNKTLVRECWNRSPRVDRLSQSMRPRIGRLRVQSPRARNVGVPKDGCPPCRPLVGTHRPHAKRDASERVR